VRQGRRILAAQHDPDVPGIVLEDGIRPDRNTGRLALELGEHRGDLPFAQLAPELAAVQGRRLEVPREALDQIAKEKGHARQHVETRQRKPEGARPRALHERRAARHHGHRELGRLHVLSVEPDDAATRLFMLLQRETVRRGHGRTRDVVMRRADPARDDDRIGEGAQARQLRDDLRLVIRHDHLPDGLHTVGAEPPDEIGRVHVGNLAAQDLVADDEDAHAAHVRIVRGDPPGPRIRRKARYSLAVTRLALSLLLATLLALPAAAEDDDSDAPPAALVLDQARVLASPGLPGELTPYLPGGCVPERLTWPLPATGPLVVLGLPAEDPVARRIADLFGFDVDPEDLHGGYELRAWQDRGRNLVFVWGADAAALYAARFEFDASAPVEMMDPNMRSLDFRKPNQEAGTLVQTGVRRVRPPYAVRALALAGDPPPHLPSRVAGAHANEVWLDAALTRTKAGARLVSALEARGIRVVRTLRWSAEPGTAISVATWAAATEAGPDMRHVAIVFETPFPVVRQMGTYYAAYERSVVHKVAAYLRPHLESLYVVPRCHADALAEAYGPPPDLRDVPEAAIAWSGPEEHSVAITREQAEHRVREAGMPVLLLDTWTAPFQSPAHVPSLPTGRAAALGDVLAGVVVAPGPGVDDVLLSAWDVEAAARNASSTLEALAFLGSGATDAMRLVPPAIEGLLRLDRQVPGYLPWAAPLAAELGRIQGPATGVLRDNELAEASRDPWQAAGILGRRDGVTLQARSDGSALHVRVDVGPPQEIGLPYLLQVRLESPGRAAGWHIRWVPDEAVIERMPAGTPPLTRVGHVHVERSTPAADGSFRIDLRFDRFALGGDAHALRHFRLGVSWGPRNVWPAAPENGALGTLLVVY
jgi:hypothetical protein